MSKILKAENMTKIAIDQSSLITGTMVAISSNITDKKTYCLVGQVTSEAITFFKTVNKSTRFVMNVTADDIIEYDMRIEVL